MNKYDVISLDMFQTLVDLQPAAWRMWHRILGQPGREEAYQRQLIGLYYEVAQQERAEGAFMLTRDIYERCFERLFHTHQIDFCPAEATAILVHEHQCAPCYEETESFLDLIHTPYRVCIVSDTDVAMLPDFYEKYDMPLYASETYGSYKNDSSNRMFKELIAHYGVEPERILHIGDSVSDVLGAQREGITACWLNRTGASWTEAVKPDYTVADLNGVWRVLEPAASLRMP